MFAFSQAFRRLIYDDSIIAQFTHDINTVASLQLRYVNVFIDFLFLTACDLFFLYENRWYEQNNEHWRECNETQCLAAKNITNSQSEVGGGRAGHEAGRKRTKLHGWFTWVTRSSRCYMWIEYEFFFFNLFILILIESIASYEYLNT